MHLFACSIKDEDSLELYIIFMIWSLRLTVLILCSAIGWLLSYCPRGVMIWNKCNYSVTLSNWWTFKHVILSLVGFARRKVQGISGHCCGVSREGSMGNNKRHCDIIEPGDGRPSHIFLDQYVCSLLLPEPQRQRRLKKRNDLKRRGAKSERRETKVQQGKRQK